MLAGPQVTEHRCNAGHEMAAALPGSVPPAGLSSREASGDDNLTEGGRSNAPEPSMLFTASTDGGSH